MMHRGLGGRLRRLERHRGFAHPLPGYADAELARMPDAQLRALLRTFAVEDHGSLAAAVTAYRAAGHADLADLVAGDCTS